MIPYFTLHTEAAFKKRVKYLHVFSTTAQTKACRHNTNKDTMTTFKSMPFMLYDKYVSNLRNHINLIIDYLTFIHIELCT